MPYDLELTLDGSGRLLDVGCGPGVVALQLAPAFARWSDFLSMSWCAPHLFGVRLDGFVADLRALLEGRSPAGRYHDWPGDTSGCSPGLTSGAWSATCVVRR